MAMNGTLKVDPQDLISAAESFSSLGSNVRNYTSQMTQIVDGLSSVWQGDAASSYRSKFHQLDDDIANMNHRIQEHVTDLRQMAANYRQAEVKAKGASSGLPTDPYPRI